MESFDRDYFTPWSSTYLHRGVIHLAALRALRARSVVRRDVGASQGPREVSVRARKAARRVVFRGHRRASPPLDDVETLASAKPPAEPGSPAQRRDGAKEPGRRSGKTAPRVRRAARPMPRIALRAAPTRETGVGPSNRFQLAG